MKSYIVLFLMFISFFSCDRDNGSKLTDESGVSLKLAQLRVEEYQNVKYNLFFDIPSLKHEEIKAKVEITLDLLSKQDIIIDFKADPESVSSIKIDGEKIKYKIENEHIIIPSKCVNIGNNAIKIEFLAPSLSLNRSAEYLYTLLVPDRARTLFPCFDQPNIKALYTLSLNIPDGWEAVSNSKVVSHNGNRIEFAETEPLSTYLFSFVAGKLNKETVTIEGREISLYHRESAPEKVAQIGDIMGQVISSLNWLEEYTDIKYPFSKYDLIILPGFQYGGMEHTGATLYSDKKMFLGKNPTINEKLSRCMLIAHETAHMWFGDFVTMNWFNDVWTKEVFANYFGSLIVAPQFPEINHDLNFLQSYAPSAYSEDRTSGCNAIQQPLDNLQDAGLIYGQTIYTKSPIVMNMLVEMIGEDAFKKGIREYLSTYAYGNATWDDLISILDRLTPLDLTTWSNTWIKEKGMATLESSFNGSKLIMSQSDKFNRDIIWSQKVKSFAVDANHNFTPFTIEFDSKVDTLELSNNIKYIIPNIDGRAYGFFKLDTLTSSYIMDNLSTFSDEVTRGALLITLYENLLNGTISPKAFIASMNNYLLREDNELLFSQALGYAKSCFFLIDGESSEKSGFENTLWRIYNSEDKINFKTIVLRTYYGISKSANSVINCFKIWDSGVEISEYDAINMSYELSISMEKIYDYIISKQRSRLTNVDKIREYDFISPALSPSQVVRDSVFNSLLLAKNREIEPYASTALYYLNHPLRAVKSIHYVRRGLDVLEEVKHTGDIFFPTSWTRSLLRGHKSKEVNDIVNSFFVDNKNYSPMLESKLRQQTFFLEFANR